MPKLLSIFKNGHRRHCREIVLPAGRVAPYIGGIFSNFGTAGSSRSQA